jgi:hypothetical protein
MQKVPRTALKREWMSKQEVEVTPALLKEVAPEWNWKRCPGCKSADLKHVGEASLFYLEDSEIPAQWLVIYGWHCQDSLHGSVVLRGPDERLHERYPVLLTSHDHQYIVNLTNRTITPLEGQRELPSKEKLTKP